MLIPEIFLVATFLFATPPVVLCGQLITELYDDDFNQKIAEYSTAIVMFYSPTCHHCNEFKPRFKEAAKKMTSDPIKFARINCMSQGARTCEAQSIQGFPTIAIYKNGLLYDTYMGSRKPEDLVKYLKGSLEPLFHRLKSPEQLRKFLESDRVSVVGFFTSDTPLKQAYLNSTVKMHKQFNLGLSTSVGTEDYGIADGLALIRPKHMRSKFEPDFVKYQGRGDRKRVEEWMRDNKHGLVGWRTAKNRFEFKYPLVVVYSRVDFVRDLKSYNYVRNRVLKAAVNFSSDFNFAISNALKMRDELEKEGLYMGFETKAIVVLHKTQKDKYVMGGDFNADGLGQFLEKVKMGQVKKHYKSKSNPDRFGAIKEVVANDFEEAVTSNDMDTVILFYKEGENAQKSILALNELQTVDRLLNNEDLVIVKYSVTSNAILSPYPVTLPQTAPQMYMARRTAKNDPIKFTGNFEFDAIIKFIAAESTEELKSFNRAGVNKLKDEL